MHRSWFSKDGERALQVETRNDKTVVSYWEVQAKAEHGVTVDRREREATWVRRQGCIMPCLCTVLGAWIWNQRLWRDSKIAVSKGVK